MSAMAKRIALTGCAVLLVLIALIAIKRGRSTSPPPDQTDRAIVNKPATLPDATGRPATISDANVGSSSEEATVVTEANLLQGYSDDGIPRERLLHSTKLVIEPPLQKRYLGKLVLFPKVVAEEGEYRNGADVLHCRGDEPNSKSLFHLWIQARRPVEAPAWPRPSATGAYALRGRVQTIEIRRVIDTFAVYVTLADAKLEPKQ